MDQKTLCSLFLLLGLVGAIRIEKEKEANKDEQVEYFTESWRKAYSVKQLQNQPRWRLAESQPDDGSYQIRLYEPHWWATSFAPCLGLPKAASAGYMDLYFYYGKFNYQKTKHSLTYPILLHVDKRAPAETTSATNTTVPTKKRKPGRRGKRGKKAKKVEVCPVKYTTIFYLAIGLDDHPSGSPNVNIKVIKEPEQTYYVREYYGNVTYEFCNEQFLELTKSLAEDDVLVEPDSWYCAKYDKGKNEEEAKLEVWMKKRMSEEM